MIQMFLNADLGIQSKFEIFVRQAILKYRNGAPF
jgi:hypothetical protein